MITATDQTGRVVSLPEFPTRIVSLVPSQTELLSYFGLENRVVGITKFCKYPESYVFTVKDDGTGFDIDQIKSDENPSSSFGLLSISHPGKSLMSLFL